MFHSWIITNYTQVLKGPFILWLHLSAITLIILLCNLSHLWCSGGKTFSLGNWDRYDGAFCGAFTCFAIEQAGFKTSEFFPDVLLNNWTYPWGLFRNSTSDCVYSPHSSMHSFLWSLWKGLCSCETIAQLMLSRGGGVAIHPSSGSLALDAFKAQKVLSCISTQGQYVLGENGSISCLRR